MLKLRKHLRNLHDGKEDGARLFDIVIVGHQVFADIKTSKKQLILVPWEDILFQVNAAINSNVVR